MNRIEEFRVSGKSVIYMDFSGYSEDIEFRTIIDAAKTLIREYAPNSLYTITNLKGATINTSTHEAFTDFTEHNKQYVILGVVCGTDTTTKILGQTVAVVSGRSNLIYLPAKEDAIRHITDLENSV